MGWYQTALGLLPLAVMLLTGRGRWEGWLIALLANVGWVYFSWCTGQWGLSAAVPVYVVLNTIDLVRWRRRPPTFGDCRRCAARGEV